MLTVGPVTNPWCSAPVQEAIAFLLHSQPASASGTFSLQAVRMQPINPLPSRHKQHLWLDRHAPLQVFNPTRVTAGHVQPLLILKHLQVNWICQSIVLSFWLWMVLQTNKQTDNVTSQQCWSLFLWPCAERLCAGKQGLGGVTVAPHSGDVGRLQQELTPSNKGVKSLPKSLLQLLLDFLPWHLTKLFLTPNWAHCYSSQPQMICNSSIWITSGKLVTQLQSSLLHTWKIFLSL